MFFSGYAGGVCPAGGSHSVVSTSLEFVLTHDMVGVKNAQPNWRFCVKCNVMFFCAIAGKGGGRCPAGDTHTDQGFNFALPVRSAGSTASVGEWFTTEVNGFKALFAANPTLVTNGQFQISNVLKKALANIFLAEESAAAVSPWGLHQAVADFLDNPKKPNAITDVRRLIIDNHAEATYPQTLVAFADDPGASASVNTQFRQLWGTGGAPPAFSVSTPTAANYKAAFIKEKDACFATTVSMAKKFQTARNDPIDYTGDLVSGGKIAGASLKNEASGRQTVSYSPAALSDAVTKIGDAITHGYVYVLGGESGVNHTNTGKAFGDPEHYLLVFAYDGAGKFAFWDSDAFVSNIRSQGTGPGFGILFFADGHFSTARDQTDFDGIDAGGDHTSEPQRHRYQIYYANPIKQ
jgi:hypothetical protein